MMFDNNLILSGGIDSAGQLTGQALSLASGTAVNSTNTIDLMQNRDLAACDDLYLYIKLLTTFTPATSTTSYLDMSLVAVDTSNDGSSGNNFVIACTGDNTIQTLNAKGEFVLRISPQFDVTGRRYLMIKYWRSMGTETVAGSVFAALTMGVNVVDNYPAGYSII